MTFSTFFDVAFFQGSVDSTFISFVSVVLRHVGQNYHRLHVGFDQEVIESLKVVRENSEDATRHALRLLQTTAHILKLREATCQMLSVERISC